MQGPPAPSRGTSAAKPAVDPEPRPPLPVVLASASPRRSDVLTMLGLSFDVVPADVEERRDRDEAPEDYVDRLSREKAFAVSSAHPGALKIAGDTIVVLGGHVLEKPAGRAEAAAMLTALSGRAHWVYSGLALAWDGKTVSRVARARVHFREFGRAFLDSYVDTGEPLDKAGAYGIQGYGSAMVEAVEGDYYTVVGLSVAAFVDLLPEVGLEYLPGRVVVGRAPEPEGG